MITIIDKLNESPYVTFYHFYAMANRVSQDNIDAALISSFNKNTQEVNSRYVNIKYIDKNKWIFFTNYNSPKSKDFEGHNQIAVTFFWNKINLQIRIKAIIAKASEKFSNEHFQKRPDKKNALSISSNQSQKIQSYEQVLENYEKVLHNKNILLKRPEYWGGFKFIPYYFEFWEGHESRINRRLVFHWINQDWEKSIIQP